MMIALVLLVLTATDAPAFKGSLCFPDSKPCLDTAAANVDVEPAERSRSWVWTSRDMSRIVFGNLDSQAATVDLASKKSRRLTLSLDGSTERGWPSDVVVVIMQGREKRWEWTIPSSSIRKLQELTVPEGNYLLRFDALRHLTERRPLRPAGDMALGAVELKPLPAIRGRVVRKEGEKLVPVIGAQIARNDGKLLTTTRHNGSFEAELGTPVPEEIIVFHPGVATRVVSLKSDLRQADLATDNDLGEIVMESGVQLALRIVRSGDAAGEKLRVRLFSDLRQKYELVPIAKRELAADEDEVLFPDLAKGAYVVAIEGDTPLEFLTRDIELDEQETNETIEITPFRLAGSVRFGEEPLRGGDVGISSSRLQREMKLSIDEEGRFGGTLWQSGKVRGWVNSKTIGSVVPTESPELGADPSPWNIVLRRRLIEGRVLDAETKQPLAGVSMRLEKETGEGKVRSRLYTSVSVGEDGRYAIAAIDNGTYDIKVLHPERVPLQQTIELRDVDPSQIVNFALQRGVETKIEFTWPSGTPVANAPVIEGVARDGHNPLRMYATDAAGRLAIYSERGEKRTLFVLPREGSLGIARLVAGSPGETSRVVVPHPVGTIQVTLRNREGNPQPSVVLLRFNGEWVPQSVVGRLPSDRSAPGVVRFTQLPAGTYELWGVKPSRDYEGTFAPPAKAPVRIGFAGGHQQIELPID